MTTSVRSTRIYRQVSFIMKAAGLNVLVERARLMTLTIKNIGHETLEVRIMGGDVPEQRILEVAFTAEQGEYLPMRLQHVLRLDATGHGLEVWLPGSAFAGTSQSEIQAYMKTYADKLEQQGYVRAASRGYSLWIQFYEG